MSNAPPSPPSLWQQSFPLTRRLVLWASTPFQGVLTTLGFAVVYLRHGVSYGLRGKLSVRLLLQQCAFVGLNSLPVAVILTASTGMVLALQVAGEMAGQGGSNYVGGLMSLAMVRELGPVMSALAVLAMAGSAYTAEITSMRQTQQLDAMSMLQVDPIRYLMLPRGVALACMLPMLTLLSTVLALWGGGWISETTAQIPPATYWDSVHQWTKLGDLGALLLKSVCFAVLIGALCCSVGFTNETNQEAVGNEVGNAVTKAVVWSFIAIAVADYGLSLLLFAQ